MKVQIFRLHPAEADGIAVPAGSVYRPAAFASARIGFALGRYPAGSYSFFPVQTTNAGRRWRIIGPALSEAAADGAIAVGEVGVAGPKTYFAWDGGGNGAIDVTADSGKVWRRVLLRAGPSYQRRPSLASTASTGSSRFSSRPVRRALPKAGVDLTATQAGAGADGGDRPDNRRRAIEKKTTYPRKVADAAVAERARRFEANEHPK